MARVVQRQGGPPYLVVTLVIIAVVASVLAVLFYTGKDKADKENARKGDVNKKLNEKVTDTNRLLADAIGKITGNAADDPMAALKKADVVLAAEPVEDYDNLALAVTKLLAQLKDEQDEHGETKRGLKESETDLKKKGDELGRIRATHEQELTTVKGEWKAETNALAEQLTAQKKQGKLIEEEKGNIIKGKDLTIAHQMQELDVLRARIDALEVEKIRLLKIIRDLKNTGSEVGGLAMRQADGKIIKVVADKDICYINLGKKDNVKLGLTLSVYPAKKGIPATGEGLAKLLVRNVNATTSDCRIVAGKADAISEGDLVANLVFSPTRVYRFVIEGEFDLYNEGRTSPEAAQKVRTLIEGLGGKVDDEVSITTDYVIVGEKPPFPPKPREDAPRGTWAAYKASKAQYDHYFAIEERAAALAIPVLNTNRFLAFSGFVPKRRLED